jgi:hypothetical protein
VIAHAVSNSSSKRQAAARWAMAGRAIKAVHFPPEKVGSLRRKAANAERGTARSWRYRASGDKVLARGL